MMASMAIYAAPLKLTYAQLKQKYPFSITCARGEDKAQITIEGFIDGWGNSAAGFRSQVRALANAGIKDAHVHLNTPGGSTVEAAEIVNVIKQFTGTITGSGGALVASAGTAIAMHLADFTLAKNGLWMYHKPSMWVDGNQDEIRNQLTLLDRVTGQYRTLYAERTGKTEEEIEASWKKGDVWLTAQEAKDQGFISGITEEVEITSEIEMRIAACGAPPAFMPTAGTPKQLPAGAPAPNKDTMDPKALRASLGLPETASDADVINKTNALKALADQSVKDKEEARTKEVKALIDAAVKDKRITEAHRKGFEAKFGVDFDATKAELASITPVPTLGIEHVGGAAPSATIKGRETWDYAEWMEKDPTGLQAMRASNPDAFKAVALTRFTASVVDTMLKATR